MFRFGMTETYSEVSRKMKLVVSLMDYSEKPEVKLKNNISGKE